MNKAFLAASLAGSLTLLGSGAASAAEKQECARGGDVRTLEVVSPGEIGAACDLRYVRDNGANVSVPYHADNSADFCTARARDMIRSFEEAGYTCIDAAPAIEPPELRAELEPAPAAPAEIAIAAAEPSVLAVPEPPAPVQVAEASQPEAPVAVTSTQSSQPLQQPAPQAEQLARVETAPLPEAASRGPVALSASPASLPASEGAPAAPAVGRITGAEPDTPVQTALASAQPPKPANVKRRSTEDLIKSVLLAQTAAWNDHDLEGFMNGFWKSGELRLISGTSVLNGWNEAVKNYRERYGDGAAMGRLSLDGVQVTMVSDEVAVVTGRYNLARADGADVGVMTMVMKRIDGLWRVVHEHASGDTMPRE